MKTNDLKKGTRIRLANGWFATLEDNARGNTRMATVEGFVKEMGSIYSHDIVSYQIMEGPLAGSYKRDIEYTPAQIKLRKMAASYGM